MLSSSSNLVHPVYGHPLVSENKGARFAYILGLAVANGLTEELSPKKRKLLETLCGQFALSNGDCDNLGKTLSTPSDELISQIVESLQVEQLEHLFAFDVCGANLFSRFADVLKIAASERKQLVELARHTTDADYGTVLVEIGRMHREKECEQAMEMNTSEKYFKRAMEWARRIESNNNRSDGREYRCMANLFLFGLGVPEDRAKSLENWQLLAEKGDKEATILYILLSLDDEELLERYKDAAENAAPEKFLEVGIRLEEKGRREAALFFYEKVLREIGGFKLSFAIDSEGRVSQNFLDTVDPAGSRFSLGESMKLRDCLDALDSPMMQNLKDRLDNDIQTVRNLVSEKAPVPYSTVAGWFKVTLGICFVWVCAAFSWSWGTSLWVYSKQFFGKTVALLLLLSSVSLWCFGLGLGIVSVYRIFSEGESVRRRALLKFLLKQAALFALACFAALTATTKGLNAWKATDGKLHSLFFFALALFLWVFFARLVRSCFRNIMLWKHSDQS